LQPPTTALADCAAYSRNCAAAYGGWALKTDHWFYGLCHSTPDLITLLLPGAAAASLGPDASGDAIYRFEAPELKTVNHRLDGALWASPLILRPGLPSTATEESAPSRLQVVRSPSAP